MRLPRVSLRRRLAVYGGIVLILAMAAIIFDARSFIESRFFYFPIAEDFPTPAGIEDVYFNTPDGLTLHAWYMPPDNHRVGDGPAPAVLHVHGNAGHIGWHVDFSDFLTREGFGVLIFDYRGFGRSDPPHRSLRREDLLVDTRAALEHLRSRADVDAQRVALYGVSVGGVLALAAAAEDPQPAAVVSVSAFASWRGIARVHGTPLAAAAVKPGLDAIDSITRLGDRPVLLVHGQRDAIVPPRHTERLAATAEAAGIPVQVLRTGSGHNDVVILDRPAQRRIGRFLEEAMPPPDGGGDR